MASKKQKIVLDEKEVAGVRRTLELLEKRYERFIDQPEKEFFLGLADYVKSIADSLLLDGLAKILIQSEREKDVGEFWKFEQVFLGEVKKVEPKILKIAKSVGENHAIKETIRELEGIKTGHIISSSVYPLALHDAIADIVRTLNESGHRELISGYVELLPDSDLISRFTLCKSHDGYVHLLEQVKKLTKISVWGSWDELEKLHGVAYRPISPVGGSEGKTRTQQFIQNFYSGAFDATINGHSDRRVFFKQADFKMHITRVHLFLTEQIEQVLNDFLVQKKIAETRHGFDPIEKITALDFQEDHQRFILNDDTPLPLKNSPQMAKVLGLFWEFRSHKHYGVEQNQTNKRSVSLREIGSNIGGSQVAARQAIKRVNQFLKKHKLLPIVVQRVSKEQYQMFVSIT